MTLCVSEKGDGERLSGDEMRVIMSRFIDGLGLWVTVRVRALRLRYSKVLGK